MRPPADPWNQDKPAVPEEPPFGPWDASSPELPEYFRQEDTDEEDIKKAIRHSQHTDHDDNPVLTSESVERVLADRIYPKNWTAALHDGGAS
jgi:hypothetical protein